MSTVRGGGAVKADLYGYDRLKRLMKEIDPDIRKRMDKEIRTLAKPIAERAKAEAPTKVMSGWMDERWHGEGGWWMRRYDRERVVKGISVRQGGSRKKGFVTKTAWKVTSRSAAGSIYELAGKKGGKTPQGRAFIANLNREGKASRLLWRAFEHEGGERKFNTGIAEIIHRYESELQARIDS